MSAANRQPERWEELVADDALVGLSPDERAELGALIAKDVVAAEKPYFERAAGEIAAVAFALQGEKEGLPAALQAKVLARFASREAVPAVRPPAPIRITRLVPWLVAAAAIVLAVVGWSRRSEPPSAERARTELLELAGTQKRDFSATNDPAAKKATGDVVWHSGRQAGFMRIRGLSPNDPAVEQYQLWIFDADRDDAYPVDGGVFDVKANDRGEVIVPIEAKLRVRNAKLFAITVEKPGGVVVSKRERIVLTASSS